MEKRKGKERKAAAWKTLPVRAGIGGAAGGAACIGMLLLWAALISTGRVGERNMGTAAMASGFLAGVAAGGIAVKGVDAGRLFTGLCAGGVLFALLMAGGVLAYGEEISVWSAVRLLCLCGGGSVLAALPGSRKKRRRH